MQIIDPVTTSQNIIVAEFVRLTTYTSTTDPGTTILMCNTPFDVTVGGVTFEGLGSLLGFSQIQRDLKVSSVDTTVTFSGIDPTMLSLVLSGVAKGGLLVLSRGFFDANYSLIGQRIYGRYSGIVTGWNVEEAFLEQTRTVTLSISASSFRDILTQQTAGRFTNQQSMQHYFPTDTSFNRVASLQNQAFDFGKKT